MCVCVCVCFNDLSSSTTLGIMNFKASIPVCLRFLVQKSYIQLWRIIVSDKKKKFSTAHRVIPAIHPFHLPKGLMFPTLKKHESLTIAIIHNCSSEVSWTPNKYRKKKTEHITFLSGQSLVFFRFGQVSFWFLVHDGHPPNTPVSMARSGKLEGTLFIFISLTYL